MKQKQFILGFLGGIILPIIFIWIYISRLYPSDLSVWEILTQLYPGTILGKLFLLSIVPNLIAVFLYYKRDNFNIAIGIMSGAFPYLIASIFML